MDGHTPDMPRHYDLHLWAFKDNPSGQFAQFNPEVSPPSWWDQYEEALTALQQYADTSQAKAAGYMNTGECEATEEGAMGIHFVNPAVQTLDPANPFALMYVPTSDTSMALLGAEYFVPADSVDSAPMMFGQVFQGPMEGHTPDMPRHYDLHLWALRTNPMGMFAEWNPMVSCP
ncbi:MAG: hypothetical protein K9N46_01020 [Candidatus Marinimicrobia bacterium]|nr:hypothetical protein [Candidatus Neomarinimicrobiota bacterium]MCF7827942.1 hypothetical protein [Candidatus Neomarinimicrobiota bacterium]MCF7879303.1 hypothetical protein [Candidatus Neomarinimicrobiota bacterium]